MRLGLAALALAWLPLASADGPGPQRAIESLEACSAKERAAGCVKILKRKPRKGSTEAIKAQLRGGRIIWYEYDSSTGRARRTN